MIHQNHLPKKTDPVDQMAIDMNNQVEAIFAFATEGILITNDRGVIVRTNPSIERMFGYASGELIGEKIELLIPTRYHEKHVKHRDTYLPHPQPRSMGLGFDLFGIRKNRTEFPVEVSLSPYESSAGKFVIGFIIDITIRKEAENQLISYKSQLEKEVEERTLILKEAIRKLEKTKTELDNSLVRERELNSMKSRFISIASHEFRTPLATVLSSMSLVEKYADLQMTDQRNKHIQRIKQSVKHLTEILNDMLTVNKVEEGKVMVTKNTHLLQDILSSTLVHVSGILKKNQHVLTDIATDAPKEIYVDEKIVKHILINLLGNAIKFSSENQDIFLRVRFLQKKWLFEVTDQGIGIPEADQPEIFNRFFRSSNASNIQGTGLGLNIVYQYVQLLDGKITFTSQENQGTSFFVQIPNE
ncbi:MAG: ATP-binding protein [Spirosomataceae bacterium]